MFDIITIIIIIIIAIMIKVFFLFFHIFFSFSIVFEGKAFPSIFLKYHLIYILFYSLCIYVWK